MNLAPASTDIQITDNENVAAKMKETELIQVSTQREENSAGDEPTQTS